jgi:hypothetical protein
MFANGTSGARNVILYQHDTYQITRRETVELTP